MQRIMRSGHDAVLGHLVADVFVDGNLADDRSLPFDLHGFRRVLGLVHTGDGAVRGQQRRKLWFEWSVGRPGSLLAVGPDVRSGRADRELHLPERRRCLQRRLLPRGGHRLQRRMRGRADGREQLRRLRDDLPDRPNVPERELRLSDDR